MNKMIQMRTRRGWLILSVAMLVPVLELMSLFAEYGRGAVRNKLAEALAGVGAIVLMLLAWKVRKQSLTKAAVLSAASVPLVLLNEDPPNEIAFGVFFLSLTPLALAGLQRLFMRKTSCEKSAVLSGAGVWTALVLLLRLLWSFLTRSEADGIWESLLILLTGTALWTYLLLKTYRDGDERARWLRLAGLLLLLFCFWLLEDFQLSGMICGTCWYFLYRCSLPLIYAWVFRLLGRKAHGSTRRDLAYFALCVLVFWDNMSGRHYGPSGEIFYLLMPLIVYLGEKQCSGMTVSDYVLPPVYTIVCSWMTFVNSERLRMVLYDLGGPAIGIPDGPRVDWLQYRIGALKSFFAGNIYYYEGQPGLRSLESSIDISKIDEPVYPFFWFYFFILVLVIATVSILLLRMRWPDAALNRGKNYLAAGYLLRAAIHVPGTLFLYNVSGVAFPFAIYSLMDFLILWLLLERNRMKEGNIAL